MPQKIIVFSTSFLDELITHPSEEGQARRALEEAAERNGLELEFRCDRSPLVPMTADELEGAAAVIADLEVYDAAVLSAVGKNGGGSLGLISRYGVGYNSVDVHAAREAGIWVTNTPGANSLPTAEWAAATLLDIAGRRIPHHARAGSGKLKAGPSRLDISGKTLGVIGTGSVGKKVVELMTGFRCRVIAAEIKPDTEWARGHGVVYVGLDTLCSESDFITIHASGGDMLIGPREVTLMKQTAVLVNCARGVLTDNREIYSAVKDGRLWGYGIDEVWEYEDLPLAGLNISASPHVGSDTDMGKVRMQLMSAQAVIDYVDGRRPEFIVNP